MEYAVKNLENLKEFLEFDEFEGETLPERGIKINLAELKATLEAKIDGHIEDIQ
jgi:hypothetical protein